jgi:hypothetical protein
MGTGDGGDLVGIAHARDRVEGEMIQGLLEEAGIRSVLHHGADGPMIGTGGLLNPGGGSRRVLVRADQAEQARALLAETLVADEQEEWPEIANARYLEEAEGGPKPRNYGVAGAYARAWTWSVGLILLAFGVFLLLRMV